MCCAGLDVGIATSVDVTPQGARAGAENAAVAVAARTEPAGPVPERHERFTDWLASKKAGWRVALEQRKRKRNDDAVAARHGRGPGNEVVDGRQQRQRLAGKTLWELRAELPLLLDVPGLHCAGSSKAQCVSEPPARLPTLICEGATGVGDLFRQQAQQLTGSAWKIVSIAPTQELGASPLLQLLRPLLRCPAVGCAMPPAAHV